MAAVKNATPPAPPDRVAVPRSFFQYVKSMGPGIVLVLTLRSAGDVVSAAASGGNYGYALMWVFALCLIVRFLFVSIIAKYQLCNQHGESLMGGLSRIHPTFAPFILVCTLLLGHATGIYMIIGASEACVKLTHLGSIRVWAVAISVFTFLVAYKSAYKSIEKLFFVLGALMTVSVLGLAVKAGPSPSGIAKGIFGFAVPDTMGRFDALLLSLSLVGAIVGGLANLMYPYFIQAKGWKVPAQRKVQQYDLAFGILVLIILDLSVWIIGAEVLHPRGIYIVDLKSLARLLGEAMGGFGFNLFYAGIFASLCGTIIGRCTGYGYLAADAYFYWRHAGSSTDESSRKVRKYVIAWIIFSPLIWVMLGMFDFVGATLVVSAAQVIIIPILVLGIWIITSRKDFIGIQFRNRWWENVTLAFLLVLAFLGSYYAVIEMAGKLK